MQTRLIALDTPGFGGSFDPLEPYEIGQLARWIAEAVENLGLFEVHLVGHHTGASIASELAHNHDWVRSVAMIGPPAFSDEDRDTLPKTFSKTFELSHDGSHLLDIWRYLNSVGASRNLDLQHREFLDTSRAYRSRAQVSSAVCKHDFRGQLIRIRQPLALLCAADDILFAAWSAAIAQRPDAFSRILSGGNFEPDLDALGCANALEDFWRDIEQRALTDAA